MQDFNPEVCILVKKKKLQRINIYILELRYDVGRIGVCPSDIFVLYINQKL